MTIRELIAALQGFDQDAQVYLEDWKAEVSCPGELDSVRIQDGDIVLSSSGKPSPRDAARIGRDK